MYISVRRRDEGKPEVSSPFLSNNSNTACGTTHTMGYKVTSPLFTTLNIKHVQCVTIMMCKLHNFPVNSSVSI